MNFKTEKDFQISLGRLLKELGYEVYTDKKICELPTFKGDKSKPDLLVFIKKDLTYNKTFFINSPFAIECKKSDKFNEITKSILQIKKYNGKKYSAGQWKGEISNVFLSTDLCFVDGFVYKWSLEDKKFNQGLNWGVLRFLFSISNKSGIIRQINNMVGIEIHNYWFELANGGVLKMGGFTNGHFQY